ncbi:MAG: patatin-like phospholipase family protein [Chitinophagales bacterium]
MRALVISGGGCKGAFGGGIAEFLIQECKNEYDIFIGSSTGSLLIPLLSIGEIEKLKEIFTTVSQEHIFNNCPFIIKKEDGQFKTRINHLGILKMFIQGKKTFGESINLKQLICKIITESDFKKMQLNKQEVIVTVSNLSHNRVEYKSLKECTYCDFCDWMWASANVVPFMSLLVKDGFEYGDGGMGNIVPIYEALMRGAREIDIILLKSQTKMTMKTPVRNALEVTVRAFDFMLNQIVSDDIIIGKLEGTQRQVKLNFFQPEEELTNNALIFDPEQMRDWWQQGFLFAKNHDPICKHLEIK